jgi:hypothetical protein
MSINIFDLFELFKQVLNIATPFTAAYLDPGSGQFILQILVASLVGVGFFFRSTWARLINKIRGIEETEDEDEDTEDAE